MHVYSDTWAHQGFAGVLHNINEVESAEETGNSGVFNKKLDKILRDILDNTIPPLGHGRATVFPDMPFLKWEYRNGKGALIKRDNPVEFLEAADHMCIAMRRYIKGDPDANVPGLNSAVKTKIEQLFREVKIEDGDKRQAEWLTAIRTGVFTTLGRVAIDEYMSRGKDSWKAQALGTSHDLPVHKYQDGFLTSNWKLFHDAILSHRFHVIHDILPKYGIIAATALVLDRSGSMSENRGDSQTKHQSLKEAASIFVDVMVEGDGVGLVRYNQDAQPLQSITASAGKVSRGLA